MTRTKQSKASFSDRSSPVKLSTLLAAGAVVGIGGAYANGAIVYTPLNITIDTAGTTSATIDVPPGTADLSENNEPIFTFTASTTNGVLMSKPNTNPSVAALVITGTPGALTPSFFSPYQQIFPNNNYTGNTSTATNNPAKDLTMISANGATGNFTEAAGAGYIGFSYDGLAAYNAGWLEFQTLATTADGNNEVKAEILGIAIENSTQTPIGAGVPEPTSLGLLAMGSVGLLNYRRRRASV